MSQNALLAIGAVSGALVTFLVAAWRFSGRIGSSDAKELWAESRSIREFTQSQLQAHVKREQSLDDRVVLLEKQVADLVSTNAALQLENREQADRLRACDALVVELRAKVAELTVNLRAAHVRIAELGGEVA